MEIRPLASGLGAEILGVDLAGPLGDDTVRTLRTALLDHVVVFFREQMLTPQELLSLAQCFGEPSEYPLVRGLPECPLVVPVIKEPHERVNFGGLWHSDTAYLEQPPMEFPAQRIDPSAAVGKRDLPDAVNRELSGDFFGFHIEDQNAIRGRASNIQNGAVCRSCDIGRRQVSLLRCQGRSKAQETDQQSYHSRPVLQLKMCG